MNIPIVKVKAFVNQLLVEYHSQPQFYHKILVILDSKKVQNQSENDIKSDYSQEKIVVRNKVIRIIVEILNMFTQEIITTAKQTNQDAFTDILVNELSRKPYYLIYRDLIPKVTKVGQESFKSKVKKDFKVEFRQYIRKFMDNSTKQKDKEEKIFIGDQTAQLQILFVSNLLKQLFVGVKLKQFKTIDEKTLFPVLLQYFEKIDQIGKLLEAARVKEKQRKKKDKQKKSLELSSE